MNSRQNLATSKNNPNLVLKPGVLTPATSYLFRLQVTIDGLVGSADVSVTTSVPPFGGMLIVVVWLYVLCRVVVLFLGLLCCA